MAHKLADEILEKVLAHVVAVPEEDFWDVSGMHSSPFARRQYSSSSVLLVCKRWMRVATPLLYDTVVLRSTAQAQALLQSLTRSPEFAPFLKRLRLEGGFGAAVGKILHSAPHLRDLYISIDLNPKDNIKAMCDALPAINPSCLALSLSHPISIGSRGITVLRSIQTSAPAWTNLTTVIIPYLAVLSTEVTAAVTALPNVSEIRLEGSVYNLDSVQAILERLPQCKVHMKYETIYGRDKAHIEAFLLANAEQLVVHRKKDATSGADGGCGLPLKKAPLDIQEKIWTVILQHALSFSGYEGVFPDYTIGFRSASGRPLAPIITSLKAIKYMTVSRMFNDICRPIALRHVSLPQDAMVQSLSSLVEGRPELAASVESLAVTSLPRFNGNFINPINLITRLSNLRTLSCCLDISDTETLRTCAAGLGLRELNISYTMSPAVAAASAPPAMLNLFAFPSLRRLRISLTFAFPRREPPTPLLRIDLPQLEELCFVDYTPGWLVNYFAEAQSPCLRFFSWEDGNDQDGALKNFLSLYHGQVVQNVAVHPAHLSLVVELCPAVQTVILAFSQDVPWSLPLKRRLEPHPSLEILVLASVIIDGPSKKATKKVAQELTAFFDAFTPDKFPALRKITVARIRWPVLPRDISASSAVKWAESLKAKGITLLDNSGQSWCPRLK